MLIPLEQLVDAGLIKPGPTLHVGAHTAEEADTYQDLGFSPVFWVEANPALHEPLRQRLAIFADHHLIPTALADEPGAMILHIANNGQSSSLLELGTHRTQHPEVHYVDEITVPVDTIDHLFLAREIPQATFVNLDVQGAELLVLQGGTGYLESVEAIYTEVNVEEVYLGCAQMPDLDEWLRARGFERVATDMTRHGWGDALYIRR